MDIKEAIIHAKQVAEGCVSGSDCAYQHDKLADWLEELEKYRGLGTIEQLSVARCRWIPVAERPPIIKKQVIVLDRYGDIHIAFQDKEGWHLAINGQLFARDPLYWMPRPKPPVSE